MKADLFFCEVKPSGQSFPLDAYPSWTGPSCSQEARHGGLLRILSRVSLHPVWLGWERQ
jgi:hypothetical protein